MQEKYMKIAIELAKKAANQDEVPIGAVIVDNVNNQIIAQTHNLCEHVTDSTAHAEILAIQEACKNLKQNRLRNCDLYVTLEPCTMCAAAISFARIENLYFGAYDKKGGAVINGVKFYDQGSCNHKPNIFSGILEEECAKLLKDFFKAKRKKND